MKLDPEGKERLDAELLGMHPAGPLRNATLHESGERATVQIADKYYRYRLSPKAKEIARGRQVNWTDVSELFTLIEE